MDTRSEGPLFAHLARRDCEADLAAMKALFAERNPGYSLEFHRRASGVDAISSPRVLFVQSGPAKAKVDADESEVDVGDIVLLDAGQAFDATPAIDVVAFTVPAEFPAEIPTYIRPDWDDKITDTPGGCATETGAYRRILLTWLKDNGPYTYHALNAHRVRITDSFTHYHPMEGGFDEFYLVQMVQPTARLLTSDQVELIERPDHVSEAQAQALLQEHELEVGDLVYMPRGLIHRGLGGVLAQVITIPGFRPGAEVGVDHHLRAINERLQLEGEKALPLNQTASSAPVIK